MLKDKYIRKITLYLSIISLIMIIAFGIAAIWNYTLLIGFIIGLFVSITAFLFNAFSAKILLSKKRSKKMASFIGILRITFQMAWYVIWVFTIIAIDSAVQGFSFGKGGSHSILTPINFLTFIVGISMVAISIVAVHIPSFFKKRKESEDGSNS